MPQTVEVRFKGTRRDFFLWTDEQDPLRLKEAVVVEAERGLDFGRVFSAGGGAKKCAGAATVRGGATASPAMRPVVRRASMRDPHFKRAAKRRRSPPRRYR
jgi:hypothetical protein